MNDLQDIALAILLVVSLVLSVLLILVSAAAFGRKLADIEYQRNAGLNGVRQIQAWINVRMHGNRVLLGMGFVLISGLLLAGAPVEWRMWSFRVFFVLLLASFLASAVLDWLGERKQLRILMAEQAARRGGSSGVDAQKEPIETPSPMETAPVSVETMSPEAAQAIADAVRVDIGHDVKSAVEDALPAQAGDTR